MSQKTSLQATETPPMYSEAARYCDEHDLPREDFERVRTMLAVQEFMRRIEPYRKMAANVMALEPGRWIMGDGYVRADISLKADRAIKEIQEMIDREAERLGLAVPAR